MANGARGGIGSGARAACAVAFSLAAMGCRQEPPSSSPAAVMATAQSRTVGPPFLSAARRGAALAPPAGVNGCNTMGFVPTDVPQHPLSDDTLANVMSIRGPLCDPRAQNELDAIITCALPVGAVVKTTLDDGTKLEFKGYWGLAPEWGSGPCNRECQEWVTSCYGVVLNAWGVHVNILAMAPKAGTVYEKPSELDPEFTNQEGAFFGNLFGAGGPVVYSCRGRGADPFYGAVRHCTLPDSPCDVAVTPVGTCDGLNGVTGEVTAEYACEGVTERGFFTRCHIKPSSTGAWSDYAFTRPITIFTRATSWGLPPSGC